MAGKGRLATPTGLARDTTNTNEGQQIEMEDTSKDTRVGQFSKVRMETTQSIRRRRYVWRPSPNGGIDNRTTMGMDIPL